MMMDKKRVMAWLEGCGKLDVCNDNCPYYEDDRCREKLMGNAFDLINEQNKKYDELQAHHNILVEFMDDTLAIIKELNARIRHMSASAGEEPIE